MDLNFILNPVEDSHRHYESACKCIKARTPSLELPVSASSSVPATMATFPPVTLATMDMDTDSSSDETMPSPVSSTDIDGYSTHTDEGLSSGDDEVMADSLFINGPRGGSPNVKLEDDGVSDDESLSSVENDSMKGEPGDPNEGQTSRCQYMKQCRTGSLDYRKVVSHIFGRNKKCTTQIPEECWIEYCRKHYQRTRYRTTKAQSKKYFNVQFDILQRQITRLERWGQVRSWEIAIRKKERDTLKKEDDEMIRHRSSGNGVNQAIWDRVHRCSERKLMPFVGKNKDYDHVKEFLDYIQREVARGTFEDMPGFELLPNIDSKAYPPRGESRALKEPEDDDEVTVHPALPSNSRKPQQRNKRSSSTPKRAIKPATRPKRDPKGKGKAITQSQDEDEPIQPSAKSVNPKKSLLRKRSSDTPNRVSKPTMRKEKEKKTRRLLQASQLYIKLEDDTDSTSALVSSPATTVDGSVSPAASKKKGLNLTLSPVPKSPSSIPPIASSLRDPVQSSLPPIPLRKKGLTYLRLPTPKTPPALGEATPASAAAASPSIYHAGFRPVNASYTEVAYRPATPKTPPVASSPSPSVPFHPMAGRIDTNSNVVSHRIPKRIDPKAMAKDA